MILFKSMIFIFSIFPLRLTHAIGRIVGSILLVVPNRRKRVIKTNLEYCFPDLNKKQLKELYVKNVLESCKGLLECGPLWHWQKNKLLSAVKEMSGEDYLQEAIEKKKGVIIVTPHLGAWEIVALSCSIRYPTTIGYRIPRIKALDSIIKNGRSRFGGRLVPTDLRGVREMVRSLKKGEMVLMLPDQTPKNNSGVFSPFFGIQTYSMTLLSRLAKSTGASVVFAYAERLPKGGGYNIRFSPANDDMSTLSIDDSVNYVNRCMEEFIRKIPEQYLWSYKRFRKRPEGETDPYRKVKMIMSTDYKI